MNSVNTTDNMYNILHMLCHSIPLPVPILAFCFTMRVSHSPVSADLRVMTNDLMEGKSLRLHRQGTFSNLTRREQQGWSEGVDTIWDRGQFDLYK